MIPSLHQVAHALGGSVIGRDTVAIPTPGHSARDRGTVITFGSHLPGGFIVHSHNGGDALEIKDMVREALGLPAWQPGDERDRRIRPDRVNAWDRQTIDREADERFTWTVDERKRIERATEIWDEAIDPRRTLAETYLHEHRRLGLPDDLAGNVLRYHPRCPWRDENTGRTVLLPALVAAFRSVDDDTLTAIHRIALKPDGDKIGRRMLGIMNRVAVKIGSPVNGELAIAEGVETAMAARELLGISCAWATGSAGAISYFPVVPDIQRLRVIGEADNAGREAIRIVGERWQRAGRKVVVSLPNTGKDFNDELMARGG